MSEKITLWPTILTLKHIKVLFIDSIFIYFVSDHGIRGTMPFEASINRNEWNRGSRLRVVLSFLLMDTSSGIIPYII